MSENRSRARPVNGVRSAVLAATAVILTGIAWGLGWLPPMERATGDLLLRISTRGLDADPTVVAILIDDLAVERYGPLPWPRDRYANLVAVAAAAGARGFAIDVLLSEPTSPESDIALARALRKTPAVLAAAFDHQGRWLLPMDIFGGSGAAAHAYGEVGPDGVVRTVAATKQGNGLSLPALSLAAARLLRPELAIEPGSILRPEFRPAPQHIPALGTVDVLDKNFDPRDLDGRLVFVGVSATGAGDQFVVPTGPRHQPVPGVLSHASAAASILQNRLLRVPGWGWSLAAALLLSFGVQLTRDHRGEFDLGVFVVLVAGMVLIAMLAVRYSLLLLPTISMLTVVVLSALLRETVESRAARRESGRLLEAVLEHVGGSTSPVPRTAAGRLDALRQVQRRVLEDDARRQALLEGMDEGVVLWDLNGEVVLANPAAGRLWNGPLDIGQISPKQETSSPLVVERSSRQIAVTLTDLGQGHLAILRDITAERTLEQKRREMQRLVSHELKTPLASIAGFGENLERYELDGEEQRRVASLIRGEAQRLQEMVTVFLDLERLGGGHWDGATETVDLGRLVASRLDVLEAAATSYEVGIARSLADGCWVRAVPALLDRVVDNLVGNAIKYTEAGDVIEIDLTRTGDSIRLSVRDRGPGIPKDGMTRLFERFYRVPGVKGTGAGLGLALVREVVDWHGGCIKIDSEIGAGSTFTVTLPAMREV
ncbi:MAG: CHASE2 domain-containing protein [Acidobacteria bacterium]|jgi:signal transduction histidine kinase|nr:CHASE2 domain-containing protein [Acidobacteriota bacterium]